jgi:hypothetical protein
MKTGTTPPSYTGVRFPQDIIMHAVWLYHRFSLSFREVDEVLFARGVEGTYATVRQWCRTFGNNTRTKYVVGEHTQATHGTQMTSSSRSTVSPIICGGPLISMGTCWIYWSRDVGTRRQLSHAFASS